MAQYNVDQIVYVRANDTSDTYNIIDSEARTLITELTEDLQTANTNIQTIINRFPEDDSSPFQTSGSTNNEQQLFLTGALQQAETAQTYSNNNVYTEGGVLYAMSSIAENNLFPIQPSEESQEEQQQEGQEEDQEEDQEEEQQQEEFEERNSAVLTWNDIQNTQLSNTNTKIPNSAIVKQYIDQKTINNWIDGLTTGAVRMINTKQEDLQHGIFMGYNAVSEGQDSFAQGEASYAQGINTIAKFRAQHVFGEYNIPDPSSNSHFDRGQYIEIVGNGNFGSSQGAIINEQYTLNIYEENSSSSTQIGTLQPGTYPYNNKIRDTSGNLWYGLIQPQGYILGVQYDPQIIYVTETEIEPSRSNARTLDWQGNEALAGGLTIGGNLVFGNESQIQYNSKTFSPFDQIDNLSQNNTSIGLLGMGQNGVGGISPISISNNGSVNSFLNQTGNWSIPSDEKLITNLVADSTTATTYYPTVGTNTTDATIKYYDTSFRYIERIGTESVDGYSIIRLGNNITKNTEGSKRGILRLYGQQNRYTDLKTNVTSIENTEIILPDKSGTIALTDDLVGISQTNTTTDNSYRVLLSNSANNTTQISTNTNKSAYLQFNPSNKRLNIGQIQIGGVDLFDLSGELTSNPYGLSLSTANATAYSSAWTPGTFRIQHWAEARGSGGTPQSTNYITEQAYFSNNLFRVNNFSAKDVVSDYSYMSPASIVTMTTSAWSNATNGVFLDNSGTIYLRKGSTTSFSITPNKIQKWDAIGTTVGGTVSNTSFPSGSTQTSLGTFSLTAGTWIVMINMRYNGNSTGVRFAKVVLDNNGSPAADAVDNGLILRTVPAGSSVTYASMCSYLKPTVTTTYHVVATQNSGSTLGVYAYYRCVKVQ